VNRSKGVGRFAGSANAADDQTNSQTKNNRLIM
jgi:hypothetical protein